MGQLVTILILLASLGGIIFILYRKIPLLVQLPLKEVKVSDMVKEGIQKVIGQRRIRPEKILDAALSKTRSLAFKAESQTGEWLEKLRKKSEQRKEEFKESYWDQLRKNSKK